MLTGPPNWLLICARLSNLHASRVAWSPRDPSSRRERVARRAWVVVVVVVERATLVVVAASRVVTVVLVVELLSEAADRQPATAPATTSRARAVEARPRARERLDEELLTAQRLGL